MAEAVEGLLSGLVLGLLLLAFYLLKSLYSAIKKKVSAVVHHEHKQ